MMRMQKLRISADSVCMGKMNPCHWTHTITAIKYFWFLFYEVGLIVGCWCQSWDNPSDFPSPCFYSQPHFLVLNWYVFLFVTCWCILWREIIYVPCESSYHPPITFQMSLSTIPGTAPVWGTSLCLESCVLVYCVCVCVCVFLMNGKLEWLW